MDKPWPTAVGEDKLALLKEFIVLGGNVYYEHLLITFIVLHSSERLD